MNEYLVEKFDSIEFNEEQVKMFATIVRYSMNIKTIRHENVVESVFKEIIKNTYMPRQNESVNGITKSELQSKIKVFTKKRDGNKYVDSEGYLSRKMCDDITNILLGASLISNSKKVQATKRGIQVALYLKNNKEVN